MPIRTTDSACTRPQLTNRCGTPMARPVSASCLESRPTRSIAVRELHERLRCGRARIVLSNEATPWPQSGRTTKFDATFSSQHPTM